MDQLTVELSDELREKLKSFSPITPTGTFPWVPAGIRKTDAPKTLWPVYTIQDPGPNVSTSIVSESYRLVDGKLVFMDVFYQKATVKYTVKRWGNWRNFNDPSLSIIEWKDSYLRNGALTEEALDLFDSDLRADITIAANLEKRLTEEELRGLELPPVSG